MKDRLTRFDGAIKRLLRQKAHSHISHSYMWGVHTSFALFFFPFLQPMEELLQFGGGE